MRIGWLLMEFSHDSNDEHLTYCPFCGENHVKMVHGIGIRGWQMFVQCPKCGATVSFDCKYREDVEEAWNRRR